MSAPDEVSAGSESPSTASSQALAAGTGIAGRGGTPRRTQGRPDDDLVCVLVPRSALVFTPPDPITVSQETCLAIFGIPDSYFRAMVRDGAFPHYRIGHLRVALVADVRKVIEAGMTISAPRPRKPRRAKVGANVTLTDDVDAMLDRAGARRTGR